MTSGTRQIGLATLDAVVAGLADRINNTLAVVLLNVEYLDDLVDDLAIAARRPRGMAGTVVGDMIEAITRIRDVVRDLEALTGDDHGDAAETFTAVLRLVRLELGTTELIDGVRGPAPVRVPRGLLAAGCAITVREVQRAVAGCRGTVTTSLRGADGVIAIGLRAHIVDGVHAFDDEHAAWREVREVLDEHGGAVAIARHDGGFAVELRLPAAR